jgi:hypothetical protein
MMSPKKSPTKKKSQSKKGNKDAKIFEGETSTVTLDELFEIMKAHVLGRPVAIPRTRQVTANEKDSNGSGTTNSH